MIRIALSTLSLALGALGCANVWVEPVENATGSPGRRLAAESSGVRFFRPAPHVWITSTAPSERVDVTSVELREGDRTTRSTRSTAEQGYAAEIVMLPDYSREYVIRWRPGLGSVKPDFELEDGWNLVGFASSIDTQSHEVIGALTGAVSNVGKLAAGGLLADSPDFRGAGLYRLAVDTKGHFTLGPLVFGLE